MIFQNKMENETLQIHKLYASVVYMKQSAESKVNDLKVCCRWLCFVLHCRLPFSVCGSIFFEFFRFIFRCDDYTLYISIFIVFFSLSHSVLNLLDRMVRLNIECERMTFKIILFCFSVNLSQFIWSKKGSKKQSQPKWLCKIHILHQNVATILDIFVSSLVRASSRPTKFILYYTEIHNMKDIHVSNIHAYNIPYNLSNWRKSYFTVLWFYMRQIFHTIFMFLLFHFFLVLI